MGDVERSSSSVLIGDPIQHVNQSWDAIALKSKKILEKVMLWIGMKMTR